MRDALSLLDQAIAYGSQTVQEKEVRSMLGAIDQSYLTELLKALIQNDGNALMSQAKAMSQRSIAFDAALNDLANLLQQIAMMQVVPDSIALDLPERPILLALAQEISAEKVQLYYQIALLGRRDIGLAPDEYAGFTMSLLRMLAFNQSENATPTSPPTPAQMPRPSASAALKAVEVAPQIATLVINKPAEAPVSVIDTVLEVNEAPTATHTELAPQVANIATTDDNEPASPVIQTNVQFNGNWRALVDALKLGLARTLAQNCELESFDENNINLTVPDSQKHLLDPNYQDKLSIAINQHFGRKIKLSLKVGGSGNTPAKQIFEEKAAVQSEAVTAIEQDDFVQALKNDFGAQIIPSSIKPI
jgi:DNA polymerase-3 subunit gamma/tau